MFPLSLIGDSEQQYVAINLPLENDPLRYSYIFTFSVNLLSSLRALVPVPSHAISVQSFSFFTYFSTMMMEAVVSSGYVVSDRCDSVTSSENINRSYFTGY